MGWSFTFQAPVGSRILRQSHSVTTFSRPDKPDFNHAVWWSRDLRRWVDSEERAALYLPFSTHAKCRSLKAFKRHLRKHEAILKHYRVILVSRFKNHDIVAMFND